MLYKNARLGRLPRACSCHTCNTLVPSCKTARGSESQHSTRNSIAGEKGFVKAGDVNVSLTLSSPFVALAILFHHQAELDLFLSICLWILSRFFSLVRADSICFNSVISLSSSTSRVASPHSSKPNTPRGLSPADRNRPSGRAACLFRINGRTRLGPGLP